MSIARSRLEAERKEWRKDHPFGFWLRPIKLADGSINMMKWEAGIPGKANSPWAGGVYHLTLEFSEEYPAKPPACKFDPPIFHPNIFPSGSVCLSILSEDKDWVPTITLKQVLLGIQDLLDNPNLADPAQREAWNMMKSDKAAYEREVRRLAKIYVDSHGPAAVAPVAGAAAAGAGAARPVVKK